MVERPRDVAGLYCRSLGAYQVSIGSLQENAFVTSRMPEHADAWIGATDGLAEGTWIWRPSHANVTHSHRNTDEPGDVSDATYRGCAAMRVAVTAS